MNDDISHCTLKKILKEHRRIDRWSVNEASLLMEEYFNVHTSNLFNKRKKHLPSLSKIGLPLENIKAKAV
jgi:hypothetical protein